MKISLSWLSDLVNFSEKDPHRIADALTLGVAEVERVEVQGELLDHCVVGKVLSVERHPNAGSLFLCDVETEKGKKHVVCGGTNLREGMLVAFAHVGATVKWHGEDFMELKKTKIRGEESEGMICGAEELALEMQFPESNGRTIVDLEAHNSKLQAHSFTIGDPLRKALGLNDTVFHVDNHAITSRADLFSHIGFARECVALGLGKWRREPEFKAPAFSKDAMPFQLKVEAPKLMTRYLSCIIQLDGLGETPDWMKRRLEATGWRSLNLPIDITNYVAMEVGVPLHSFDADDIRGSVHMRTAKKGEKIVTLDKKERELPEGGLVLSDDEGIFDLLGIMGGLRSSTKESTRRIYLHSATLDPVSIRKAVIATGLRTDAATTNEKGVPHIAAEQGFYRAIELMLELIPGAKIASVMDSKGDNGSPEPIILSLERVSSRLGREITEKEATKILTSLDFKVSQKLPIQQAQGRNTKNQKLAVLAPLHRLGDIHSLEDISEEIARITGFTRFEEQMPIASITPPTRDHRVNKMRDSLKEMGFTETVQFSFLGKELLKRSGSLVEERHLSAEALAKADTVPLQEIENPLGEDLKYMRPSLRPRLLEYAGENIRMTESALRLFEVGHVFKKDGEPLHLSLLVATKRDEGLKGEPFLVAKAASSALLSGIGYAPFWKDGRGRQIPCAHPARRLELFVGKTSIGAVYEVHPSVCKHFDFPHRVAIATIDLTALLNISPQEKIYKKIPEFPSIEYDTTVSFSSNIEVGPLLEKVSGFHEFLQSVRIVDLFQKGKERHVTLRCTYNAKERTLQEEEVKPIQEKVEKALNG